MPILKREPDMTPDVFTRPTPWQIAHVRPRKEKALARRLAETRVAYYLPQIENTTEAGRTSWLPLYPGYLFFRGEKLEVVKTGLVAGTLEVFDQNQFETELRQIHDLQQSGARLTPLPSLEEGDLVTVRDGAFAGFHGRVVRIANEERLIVSISVLNRHVLVEFSRTAVRKAVPRVPRSSSPPPVPRSSSGSSVPREGSGRSSDPGNPQPRISQHTVPSPRLRGEG